MELEEFLEGRQLPDFEHNIQWKKKETNFRRRNVNFEKNRGLLPSLWKTTQGSAAEKDVEEKMTRQRSTEMTEAAKKT